MDIWNFIQSKFKEDKKVILLTVIESAGSSPGRTGFKMAVSEDFDLAGSIGGGIMEYQMVEMAKKLFSEDFAPFIKRQNHNKEAEKDQSGMICSGHQVILFYPLNKIKHTNLIHDLINCLQNNCKKTLSIYADKIILDNLPIENQYLSRIKNEKVLEYHEQISYKNEIFIIGGGHVGLALSEMMRFLDFYVHIIDDRKDLNTLKQNRFAHKIHHIHYDNLDRFIPEGNNIYIVIMTHKHVSDKNVLKNLIHKKVKYLGLMGSKTKVKKIFEQLKNKSYTEKQLQKVHAPIGVDIKSETPAEIA